MSASEPSKTPDEPAIDATEPDEEPEQPRRDKGKRKLADDEVEAELAAERKRRQVEEGVTRRSRQMDICGV